MKIIVSAGGSLGHINPALAIIKKFKEKEKNLKVLYIGTHNRMEKDIIPKENIPYESLEIYGFTKNMKQNIKNVALIQKALKKCYKIMDEFQPDVVIGVGGYVTYPVLKAATKKGIPTFIHEQNSIPGKTNRVVSKYADLIGVTFKTSMKYFHGKGKVIYTGHPNAKEALLIPKLSKKDFGLSLSKKLVVVMAGSQGSGSLNEKMKEFLKKIETEDFEVLYITGKNHYDEFIKDEKFSKNVIITPFVDHAAGLLKNADVVISRAGGASLFELVTLEIPSIIIPSPNVANNHQYYNALELSESGAICMMEEKNLNSEELLKKVKQLLEDKNLRHKYIEQMKKLSLLDSSEIIYQEIKGMMK